MYHRVAVTDCPDRYTVSANAFKMQMFSLRDMGYRVLTLTDTLGELFNPRPSTWKAVCLTFDDGFLDTSLHAAPLLEELQWSATFFVVSGLMGKENLWRSLSGSHSKHPLLGWREAQSLLAAGFELGSHTATHPVLTDIGPSKAGEEIHQSKLDIEERLGRPIRYFAYPYGRFDQHIQNVVRAAGYEAACSTLSGFANKNSDRYALRRIEIFGGDSLRVFRRKLRFGANEMSAFEVARYYARRAMARCIP